MVVNHHLQFRKVLLPNFTLIYQFQHKEHTLISRYSNQFFLFGIDSDHGCCGEQREVRVPIVAEQFDKGAIILCAYL